MVKAIHPDGEGHPYQQTVAQASRLLVAQASTLCSTLTMDWGIVKDAFYPYTQHGCQWRICHLIWLALDFWTQPAQIWGVLLSKSPKFGGFRGQWVNPDLETLAIEDA
ncbi:MAG: hypothetical protein F6K56_14780 [Moorea sp. SIO3G5]|nr:hypothetical protein [Moorena sp. SIO3G5]